MSLSCGLRVALLVVAGGAGLAAVACGAAFSTGPGDAGGQTEAGVDTGTPDTAPSDGQAGGDGTASDSTAPSDAGPPMTVSGTVVDSLLAPLPQVTVHIGAASATTDAHGQFSIPNVLPLYTAIVVVGSHGYVFSPIVDSNPTLQLLFDVNPNTLTATISGTVATGDTPGAGGVVFADVSMAFAAGDNSAAVATGSKGFSGTVAWVGPNPVQATLYNVQWLGPADGGPPTAYIAYAYSSPETLASGQTVTWAVPASVTPVTDSLPVTVNVTSGYLLSEVALYMRPQGSMIAGPILQKLAPPSSLSLITPAVSNATFVVCAVQGLTGQPSNDVPYGVACNAGLGPSQSTTLTPPPATTLVSPPSTAGLTTLFSWNHLANGISAIAFEPATAGAGPSYYVVTPLASAHIPDLSAFGLALPSKAAYKATVYGVAPFATLDEALTPAGFASLVTALRLDQGPLSTGAFSYGGSSPFSTP